MKLILFVFLLGLSGCATTSLTTEENAVRLLRRSDPPAECKELGKVTAYGAMSIYEEGREADLKKATHKLGGDTVTIDRRDDSNSIYGTAFSCKKPALP